MSDSAPVSQADKLSADGSPVVAGLGVRAPVLVLRRSPDAVQEFGSEHDAPPSPLARSAEDPTPPRRVRGQWGLATAVGLAAVGGVGIFFSGVPGARGPRTARVVIESTPPGAMVLVGSTSRGVTPVELELPAGSARIVLRREGAERLVDLHVRSGETVRQLVDIAPAAPPVSATGTLEVTSDPPRVPLFLDGVPAGTSPLNPTTLSAGEHVLTARFRTGPVEQRVQVVPGRTSSLHMVSRAEAAGAVAGWLNVQSPIALRIFEDGRLLGTTDVDRVMLPVGSHVLRFVSDEAGFETTHTVAVEAGRPSMVAVALPTATLSINARPWAEVFIDGERVGETPIGNLVRPIGRHEIVLRHPELGERRQTVLLSLRAPARVSVDLHAR